MKKITTIALLLTLLVTPQLKMMAQAPHPNVIKLNLFALGLSNISLQYERGFHKNMSFAIGAAVLPSRTLPSQITKNDSSGTLSGLKFNGFSITPEFRFYPGKKVEKQAPKGFYLAPYFRYTKYTMSTVFSFDDSTAAVSTPVDMKVSYSGIGGGLMMGCQWLIKDRVSIDWWILGFHGGAGKVSASLESSIIGQDPDSFREQLEDIESPRGTVEAEVDGNTAKLKLSGFPYLGIRTGLCLGIAF